MFRGSMRMNGFRKRQLRDEEGENGDDGSPAGKRIKLAMATNPGVRGKVVKALEGFSEKSKRGAEASAKLPLELLPVEIWQRILADLDDPREFHDLFKVSSQFRTIINPRSLRFAVDFDHTSNAEEAMWDMVVLIGESCGSSVWNLEIAFGDFSFDFYVHLVQCLRLMPNLKSLRLRLSPVGKLRTSKLIGPQSHGDYLDYSWTFEEMWQYIEDHPLPRLPQLTHLDLDVNEDAMDFLSVAILPAYARQITKFETRIQLCLRFTRTLIFSTGLFRNVTELHLKQVQSIGQLDEMLAHIENSKPPLIKLCLYLTRAVNVVDLLELVEPFKVKILQLIESEKGAALYELSPYHVRNNERVPTTSSIESLELKDSRHLCYEFLKRCVKLQCLTVLKNKSCRRVFKDGVNSVPVDIAYQLRTCLYATKRMQKKTKIWDMMSSLATLQIKSSRNELKKTLKRNTK